MVLGEQRVDKEAQVGICAVRQGLMLHFTDHFEHLSDSVTVEGFLQRDQLVQDHTYTPHICF